MFDPYEELINAIVTQAAHDYIKALKQLKGNPRYWAALQKKKEIERFFLSDWYGMLTKVDPEYLLEQLRKTVRL